MTKPHTYYTGEASWWAVFPETYTKRVPMSKCKTWNVRCYLYVIDEEQGPLVIYTKRYEPKEHVIIHSLQVLTIVTARCVKDVLNGVL